VVVPIVDGERLIGVLDLDSPVHGRFDNVDARGLEALVRVFVAATRRGRADAARDAQQTAGNQPFARDR
jgi:GAF domain-containing protein